MGNRRTSLVWESWVGTVLWRGGGRGEYAEKHAQGLLRALVHGLHPSVMVRLLRHGQALGGVPAEQARLLIRVCGGDVALIERAKWALQAMGML